jgi:hypothetical protein
MIDTMRAEWPTDMARANEFPVTGTAEELFNDAFDRMKHFARENPGAFALTALGIGFILGWKLKPW